MTVYDRIDFEMQKKKINRRILSEETGISYNTLTSLWQRKSPSMKLTTLKKISEYLNVTMEYLLNGKDNEVSLDNLELEIANTIKKLSIKNKSKVLLYACELLDNENMEEK